MQRAAETQKTLDGQRAWGSEAGNIGQYIETHLGVDDHEKWALDVARELYGRQQELDKLMQTDPGEYHRRQQELARSSVERRSAWEKRQADAKADAEQRGRARADTARDVTAALKDVGLDATDAVMQVANRIFNDYRQAEYDIDWPQLAALTRDKVRQDQRQGLAAMDDDTLLATLGDKLRERLRKAEATAARGSTSGAAAAKPAAKASAPEPGSSKGVSDAEFNKLFNVRNLNAAG